MTVFDSCSTRQDNGWQQDLRGHLFSVPLTANIISVPCSSHFLCVALYWMSCYSISEMQGFKSEGAFLNLRPTGSLVRN